MRIEPQPENKGSKEQEYSPGGKQAKRKSYGVENKIGSETKLLAHHTVEQGAMRSVNQVFFEIVKTIDDKSSRNNKCGGRNNKMEFEVFYY